jgi:hypothetical protein
MIFLTENVPYTPKMLADELDFEENTVILALQALENLDMIVTENGCFTIAGWEEYQNIEGMDKIREQNRIRKQRQREKQKLLEGMSQDRHVTVTECHDIEEEKEEDKEKDKEKDKEYHSIIHSCEEVKLKYMGGTLGQGVVLMSDEQFRDLCDKLSIDEIDKYMGIIVECEMNGKRYKKKSHYQAILEMADKDRRLSK